MRVKEQRLKAGMTRPELSKRTGLTVEAIYKIEKNPQRGRVVTFKLIADALGCKVDDLI